MNFTERWIAGGAYTVIVANAPAVDLTAQRPLLAAAADLIAADGGALTLLHGGRLPQLVIGDLDSLPAAIVAQLATDGCTIARYPAAKDETDLELALAAALQRGARRLLIMAALGGRWDQSLANIALLGRPDLAGCEVAMRDGTTMFRLVRDRVELHGPPGSTVSLLPFGAAADGVSTDGLVYALSEARLDPVRARGVSNVLLHGTAEVRLRSGALLVISDEP